MRRRGQQHTSCTTDDVSDSTVGLGVVGMPLSSVSTVNWLYSSPRMRRTSTVGAPASRSAHCSGLLGSAQRCTSAMSPRNAYGWNAASMAGSVGVGRTRRCPAPAPTVALSALRNVDVGRRT